MFETILVGYDESQYSKAALVESANWIKKHGGKLIIVHAVFFDTEEFGIAPEQHEKRVKIGEKACVEAKETISREFGIEVKYILCEGEPPEAIADIARERKVDLIALGTYGRRGLKRLIMGSVTSKVIADAPCDVLVVKKPCEACTGDYKSILVPFDGSEFSKRALDRACRLSKACGADVASLYVIPRYEELEFLRTGSMEKSMMKEAKKVSEAAASLASGHSVSIKGEIAEGPAAEKVVETAQKLKSDLIVMGSYGYTGVDKAIMGSTTERVIIHASAPVLVVR